MYTSKYFLKSSKISSELCIKSEEEFRLWQELKNLYNDVICVAQDNPKEKVELIKDFSIRDKEIYISKYKI